MEKISHALTRYIILKKVIDKSDYNLYQYGFQIGLEILLNTIVSILIAAKLDMTYECILFFLIFIPLRSYAGGFHLDRYITCLITSCVSLGIMLYIAKSVNVNNKILLLVLVVGVIFIKLLAPVIDDNRSIYLDKMESYADKLNITLLFILLLALVFLGVGLHKMLTMLSIIVTFMVGVLVLGKIKYNILRK